MAQATKSLSLHVWEQKGLLGLLVSHCIIFLQQGHSSWVTFVMVDYFVLLSVRKNSPSLRALARQSSVYYSRVFKSTIDWQASNTVDVAELLLCLIAQNRKYSQ